VFWFLEAFVILMRSCVGGLSSSGMEGRENDSSMAGLTEPMMGFVDDDSVVE